MSALLCKDCKHSFRRWTDIILGNSERYTMRCRLNYKASEEDLDLVMGPKITEAKYETCGMTRLDSQPCGVAGKLWQPKNKRDLFRYIKKVAA
jgi:hypothetical protein